MDVLQLIGDFGNAIGWIVAFILTLLTDITQFKPYVIYWFTLLFLSPIYIFVALQVVFVFMALGNKEEFPLITYFNLNIKTLGVFAKIIDKMIDIITKIIIALTTWIP